MIKTTSTFALLATFMLAPVAMAETVSQPGFSRSRVCYMDKYKETYVPGTERSPGYVTSKKVRVEVDCEKYARKHNVERYRRSDSRYYCCLLYTSPSPRDQRGSRMPSSA